MAEEIKLTKNELRIQQVRLSQLKKYLPTLQLKKAMLQSQVNEVRIEIEKLQGLFNDCKERVAAFSSLFSEEIGIDLSESVKVGTVHKNYDNIAGVEVPTLESIDFHVIEYSFLETPPWVDAAIDLAKEMVRAQVKVEIAEEKREALEKELREVSIRVNLFEKILIPRTIKNIKKIKVFLGDQELSAVAQAKVAKTKIESNRKRRLAACV